MLFGHGRTAFGEAPVLREPTARVLLEDAVPPSRRQPLSIVPMWAHTTVVGGRVPEASPIVLIVALEIFTVLCHACTPRVKTPTSTQRPRSAGRGHELNRVRPDGEKVELFGVGPNAAALEPVPEASQ